MKKRFLSLCLAALITAQTAVSVFAENEDIAETQTSSENECEFSFSAAQYVLSESEGTYDITVKRSGNADLAVDVAVKLIDLQSEYGKDYIAYDEDGNALEKKSGIELVQSDEGMLEEALSEGNGEESEEDEVKEEKENKETVTATSARAALYGVEAKDISEAAAETASNVEKSLETMYDGLSAAEGVLCRVSFDKGQTEKTFTVEITDNKTCEADRVVLMAITAVSSGSISAKGTAVLTIEDDEEYEKPIISVESDVIADRATGTAEVTLLREIGVNYFTSVYAYTYSESAKADEDFVPINGSRILFVPGETKKTVTVEIKDFSEKAQFGLRIEPDSTCGISARADRATVYIEADGSSQSEKEDAAVLQSLAEDHVVGVPYFDVGIGEWKTGPGTRLQTDSSGNVWAVAYGVPIVLAPSKIVKNAVRSVGRVEIFDENKLLVAPLYTDAEIDLSSTAHGNLEKYLKNHSFSIGDSLYARFKKVSRNTYAASLFGFDTENTYTPNIAGSVKIMRNGRQIYPSGLRVYEDDKIMPLLPMRVNYRKYTVREYSSTDKFTDIRYDLSDGKYTEKPILDSEYTPPAMYLYDDDGNIIISYYADPDTVVFFDSCETVAKQNELFKKGIRPKALKACYTNIHCILNSVELKTTDKISIGIANIGDFISSEYTRVKAKISFVDTSKARFVYKDSISAYVGEEVKIRALVESASDRIMKFTAVPVYKKSDGSEYGKYEWSSDISCVNGETVFNVPPVRIENEDNFVRFDIIPQVEECKVIVKPIFYDGNNDGKNDFVLPEGAESYEGVVMVESALGENSEETIVKTDSEGNMSYDTTPHAPIILRAVCPPGYTVTWWDLSGDLNGDGIIDNTEIAEGQLDDSGQRYFTVSGDVYCGSAWNGSTVIGYGFKKKVLDTTGVRNGTVRIDTRSFYDLVQNGSTRIPAGSLKPVAGVNVTIGGVTAKTDSNGNFEMDMSESNIEADGNIAPMIIYSDGSGSRTVYVGNISPERFRSDLRIPAYDVYVPKSLTARYNGENNLTDNTILIKDKLLAVQAQVEIPESGAADVLTGADFTIVDENGRVRDGCDFTERQKEQEGLIAKAVEEWKARYPSKDWDKLDEVNKGLYLVGKTVKDGNGNDVVIDCYTGFDRMTNKATLVFNPKKFASTNDRIFISYKDDQRNYRRMNLGYTFLNPPSMGRFILGAVGKKSSADSITLLGIPMLNFDMGEIEGFYETTGKVKGAPTVLDGADYRKTYNAVRFGYGKTMNFDNNETFLGWWNYGTQFESDKANTAAPESASEKEYDPFDDPNGNNRPPEQGNNPNGNNRPDTSEPADNNDNNGEDGNQKNSSVGLGEGDSAGSTYPSRVNTLYNYSLTPEFGFEMVLSSRGKYEDGTDRYGFESLRAYLSVTGHYDVLVTIDLVKLVAIEIQPKIDVNVTGVYMLRSTYDDEINLEPVIEYGGENSGFRPFNSSAIHDDTRSYGYLGINPLLEIEAGLKITVVRVRISASFEFDFDFLFDSQSADKTYGMMTYKTTLRIMLFSFDVYTLELHNPLRVHLFGEDEPLEIPTNDNIGVLASDDGEETEPVSLDRAILAALEESLEDSVVTQSDRSYLSDRSEWLDGGVGLFSEDEGEEPRTLLKGASEYGSMKSVRFGDDAVFAVYVDDVPDRDDVNRYALYYTYSKDGGSTWQKPEIIDDDGTLDDYPALCLLSDGNILITWSSADKTLGDGDGINEALSAMNLKSCVFDTESAEIGEVMQVTHTTLGDVSSDTYSAPAPFVDSDGNTVYRVYYLKADYNITSSESAEVMDCITSTESVIAYRDYNTSTGEWSQEYTEEQRITLSESGADPDLYEEQWYGQQFVDTRLGADDFNYITEIAACSTGGISYLAYIVDWDKDMRTSDDRDIFVMCNDDVGESGSSDPSYKLPVRITAETGSYSELEFASGTGVAMLFFHSDGFVSYDADGNEGRASGIAYADIAAVFQHGESGDLYAPTLKTAEGGGYREFWYVANELDENYDFIVKELRVAPSEAVLAPYNDFAVTTDRTGRAYIVWTEPDEKTNKMTLFAAVYNLPPETQSDDTLSVVGWSEPVALLTDSDIVCGEFTVQSVYEGEASDKLRILFKGEKESGRTDLMTASHRPSSDVTIDRIGMTEDYLYDNGEVTFTAFSSNHGLAADRTVKTRDSEGTEYLAPDIGTYVTEFWLVGNGEKERIGAALYNGVLNPSQSIFASCTYRLEGSVPDGMSVEARLFDASDTMWGTEDEIAPDCEEYGLRLIGENEFIIEKRAELSADTLSVEEYNSRETDLLFEITNNGNIPAKVTATISAVKDGVSKELNKVELGSLGAKRMIQKRIRVKLPENMLTEDELDSSLMHYTLELELRSEGETVAVRSAEGAVMYNSTACEMLSNVEKVDFGSNAMLVKVGESKEIGDDIIIQSENENSLRLVSSDESILRVVGNSVVGVKPGKATLTAYAVPNISITQINSLGVGEEVDVLGEVPESLVKSDEITVTVKKESTSTGGISSATYKVTFEPNGGSKIGSETVSRNAVLSEPKAPEKEGFTFDGWYTDRELTNRYDFGTKVTESFTLYAKWSENEVEDGEWENPFVDVAKADWFYESVRFAYERGLFSGVSETKFAPKNIMTRGMLVTVLYRAEGEPKVKGSIPFADVDTGAYYANAVIWAEQNGIVKGVGENEFAPNRNITREQIAAIMYRYAAYKGYDLSVGENTNIRSFADFGEISEYALLPMQYAVGAGLMKGKTETTLNPRDNATRAEIAAILMRFIEGNR